MQRKIILDTETTGLEVEQGHRIIEIGCLEMQDRKLTGKYFHYYVNPERDIDAGALAKHGITSDFLLDKPYFSTIAEEFIEFVREAELIIHNAPFDLAFLNNELLMTKQGYKNMSEYCTVFDTLVVARKLHVGKQNNLDALCKRYGIDNSKREYHGALLDANLLAQVYLAMTGGQGSFFDALHPNQPSIGKNHEMAQTIPLRKHNLLILKANEDELLEHNHYLQRLRECGTCLWWDED